MNKFHRLIVTIALTSAASLFAQSPPAEGGRGPRHGGPGGPGRGHGFGSPIVRALDTDKDGELSAAEIAAAATSLKALDKNSDGAISADELRPPRPAGAPEGATPPPNAPSGNRPHPADPVMLALDANADGTLSATEIANAARSLAALDLNKDGKLTRDELRPLPPAN